VAYQVLPALAHMAAKGGVIAMSKQIAMEGGALGEVRIHQQIYKARADIGGIVRFQSPKVVSISALGRTRSARHGFGSYFALCPLSGTILGSYATPSVPAEWLRRWAMPGRSYCAAMEQL
jgi:hypothetical protein